MNLVLTMTNMYIWHLHEMDKGRFYLFIALLSATSNYLEKLIKCFNRSSRHIREFKFDFQYQYRYQQPVMRMRSGQQKHKAVCSGSRDNRSRLDFGSREYTTGLEVNCADKLIKKRYFVGFLIAYVNCLFIIFV